MRAVAAPLATVIMAALLLCAFAKSQPALAGVYARPGDSFGQTHYYVIRNDESLIEIARTFNVGYNEIVAANPGIDPFTPPPDTAVIIPSTWILPDMAEKPGIVINIPEMRLYVFQEHGTSGVLSFPVGIGGAGRATPLGRFTIIDKIVHPSWYVPRSIRRARPKLPAIVPPGRDNPMGSHALRLSKRTILIHGTNRPFSIGRQATHGCIRLYPEDIARLFQLVQTGTPVTIIDQPVKITEWNGQVYVETHGSHSANLLEPARKLLRGKGLYEKTDETLLKRALHERRGIPVNISPRRKQHGSASN